NSEPSNGVEKSSPAQYDGKWNHMKIAVLFLIGVISCSPQELSHTTEPTLIHKVEPEYTKEALDAKLQGDVILSVVVGADGVPSDIDVIRRLGMGLDE